MAICEKYFNGCMKKNVGTLLHVCVGAGGSIDRDGNIKYKEEKRPGYHHHFL